MKVSAPLISVEIEQYGPDGYGWHLTVDIDRQRVLDAHVNTKAELTAQLDLTLAQLSRRIGRHVEQFQVTH